MAPETPDAPLASLIAARTARVGVIGLGYVGLPLAVTAARAGFPVTGYDIDPAKITAIAAAESYIEAVPQPVLAAEVAAGRFAATGDFTTLGQCDVIVICVPTPLTRHREPDLSFVTRTCEDIAATLRRGQLIVLESTTYPGTTDGPVKTILEGTGLSSGSDFFLGFSPEREDPGNRAFDTSTIPKVVAGDGPAAGRLMQAFYGAVVKTVVPVSTPATAEAVKITENVFRAVNIALVNELKVIYDAMGIDVWEVIDAAKTKPFGFMPFYPGPGLGGHCIPIDPFYLTWKSREYELTTRFIELAGEINSAMPRHVVSRLAEALDRRAGPGAEPVAHPRHRPRLQEERARHPRKPLAEADRADRGAGGRGGLSRSLRAADSPHTGLWRVEGSPLGAADPREHRRVRRGADRDRSRRHRLSGARRLVAAAGRHAQRLCAARHRLGQDRQGVSVPVAILADAHVHDIHGDYGTSGIMLNGRRATLRSWHDTARAARAFNESGAIFDAALAQIRARGIRHVVLLGDYTDDGQAETTARLAARLHAASDLRFYAIPGNHDVFGPHGKHTATRFRTPTGTQLVTSDPTLAEQDRHAAVLSPRLRCAGQPAGLLPMAAFGLFRQPQFLHWESPFGPSDAVADRQYDARSPDGLNTRRLMDASYLVEPAPGLWLLLIDANVFEPRDGDWNERQKRAFLDPATAGWTALLRVKPFLLPWIADVTARAKAQGKSLLTLSHYPALDPFEDGANHEHALFGETEVLHRRPAPEVAEALAAAGVRLHVSGHIHCAGITRQETRLGTVTNVAVPSLVSWPPGFAIAHATPDGPEVEIVPLDPLPLDPALVALYRAESADAPEMLAAPDITRFLLAQSRNRAIHRVVTRDWPREIASGAGLGDRARSRSPDGGGSDARPRSGPPHDGRDARGGRRSPRRNAGRLSAGRSRGRLVRPAPGGTAGPRCHCARPYAGLPISRAGLRMRGAAV